MPIAERLERIVRCVDEINLCQKEERPGSFGALIGELDQLGELHDLLYCE